MAPKSIPLQAATTFGIVKGKDGWQAVRVDIVKGIPTHTYLCGPIFRAAAVETMKVAIARHIHNESEPGVSAR